MASNPQPLIIIPGDDDQARGYRLGVWSNIHGKQFTNYECIYCQFSTLWLEGKKGMKAHQAEGNHPWAYPGQYPPELEEIKTGDPEY